jgi:hypothetical protein
VTPTSLTFRQTNRAYGTRIPLDDVSNYCANGWRPVEIAEEMYTADGRLLLRPPAPFLVAEAAEEFGLAHRRSLPDARPASDSEHSRQAHLTQVVPVIHSMEPAL